MTCFSLRLKQIHWTNWYLALIVGLHTLVSVTPAQWHAASKRVTLPPALMDTAWFRRLGDQRSLWLKATPSSDKENWPRTEPTPSSVYSFALFFILDSQECLTKARTQW